MTGNRHNSLLQCAFLHAVNIFFCASDIVSLKKSASEPSFVQTFSELFLAATPSGKDLSRGRTRALTPSRKIFSGNKVGLCLELTRNQGDASESDIMWQRSNGGSDIPDRLDESCASCALQTKQSTILPPPVTKWSRRITCALICKALPICILAPLLAKRADAIVTSVSNMQSSYPIARRVNARVLLGRFQNLGAWTPQQPTLGSSPPEGVLAFPDWLSGLWQLRCKGENFTFPAGLSSATLSSGQVDPDTVIAAMDELKSQRVTTYFSKYASGADGFVRQDRAFNAKQEIDAFSGYRAVQQVSYDRPRNGREKLSIQLAPDPEGVSGEGSGRIELEVLLAEWCPAVKGEQIHITREVLLQRSEIVGSDAEEGLFESIVELRRVSPEKVIARNRLIKYPVTDGFAGNRPALAIFDYTWEMYRSDSKEFGIAA